MIENYLRNIPVVVKNLLIINILMVFGIIVFEGYRVDIGDYLGIYHWSNPKFNPYQLISYLFVHASYSHLFSNLITLLIFGYSIERYIGSKNFLLFYLSCGIGAGLIQLIVIQLRIQYLSVGIDPSDFMMIASEGAEILKHGMNFNDPTWAELNGLINTGTVGASGAVFGVLMAYGMLFGERVLFPIPIKAKYFVLIYGITELMAGVTNDPADNVAHFAHLGGMLFGYILLKIWKVEPSNY